MKNSKRLFTLMAVPLTAITVGLLTGCEITPRYGEVRVHDRHYDVRVVLSDRDRLLIRDYYAPRYSRLPPGLAKLGKVPPGHAKKLYRNAPVPHDYRWDPVPRELEGRLSHLPDGYVRITVGGDIAIMNVRTRVVVDLLEGIVENDNHDDRDRRRDDDRRDDDRRR